MHRVNLTVFIRNKFPTCWVFTHSLSQQMQQGSHTYTDKKLMFVFLRTVMMTEPTEKNFYYYYKCFLNKINLVVECFCLINKKFKKYGARITS